MKNFWVQRELPFVVWSVDLTHLIKDPDALLESLNRVRRIGESMEVFSFPPGVTPASDMWSSEGSLDMFAFRGIPITARMAFFEGNVIVERDVADLAKVLDGAQPFPGAIDSSDRDPGYHPVHMSGQVIRYTEGRPQSPPPDLSVSVELHTDIWFPFVKGHAHPWRGSRWFDNRELSRLHTPRLNAFLRELRQIFEEVNGIWRFAAEECRPDEPDCVRDFQVILDRPTPELVPNDAFQHWADDPDRDVFDEI